MEDLLTTLFDKPKDPRSFTAIRIGSGLTRRDSLVVSR